MSEFFLKIKNIFSVKELRLRLLNTFYYLIIFRIGSYVVLPGIDSSKLSSDIKGIFGLLNTFLGGAFSNASVFALGIPAAHPPRYSSSPWVVAHRLHTPRNPSPVARGASPVV